VSTNGGGWPSVSVVTAVFNGEETIADALRSALAQTVQPLEIVVVNDGSTDSTLERLAEVDGPVRVICQDNSGPSVARNRAMAEATGEWIAFLDADDIWCETKLESQLGLARIRPDAVLVASDWSRANPALCDGSRKPHGPAHVTWFDYRDILVLNRFQTSSVILRAEVASKLGGFHGELDGVEDWDMWLRASCEGTIGKLDQPLVAYRDMVNGYSKNLDRVYRTMRALMAREAPRAVPLLGAHGFDTLRAWHQLRFAVAYHLAGDSAGRRQALSDLGQDGLWRGAWAASGRYLAPFLAKRAMRRLRK